MLGTPRGSQPAPGCHTQACGAGGGRAQGFSSPWGQQEQQRSGQALEEELGEDWDELWGKLTQPPHAPLLRQRLPGGANLLSKWPPPARQEACGGATPWPQPPTLAWPPLWGARLRSARLTPCFQVSSCAGGKEPAWASGPLCVCVCACAQPRVLCTRSRVLSGSRVQHLTPRRCTCAKLCTRPHAGALASGARLCGAGRSLAAAHHGPDQQVPRRQLRKGTGREGQHVQASGPGGASHPPSNSPTHSHT